MQLNINNKAVRQFTAKLEKMHRSALPSAIRGTLNGAAFDVKKNTMLKSAKKTFVQRSPNFFKANSGVAQAKGFNVSTMKSMVGFMGKNLKGKNNQAAKDLEQQEYGGRIKNRAFIPTDKARISKSSSRNVTKENRLINIKKIVNTRKIPGKTPATRFVKAVNLAGKKGIVLADYKGSRYLWRVNSLKKTEINKKTGKRHFKLTKLYTFEEGRSVKVDATAFMRTATLKTGKTMSLIFEKEAKRQFQRLLK